MKSELYYNITKCKSVATRISRVTGDSNGIHDEY